MKDRQAYELDLQLMLENWQLSLMDLDFVGDMSLSILKNKLMSLYDSHQIYNDSDLQSMNDSLGG